MRAQIPLLGYETDAKLMEQAEQAAVEYADALDLLHAELTGTKEIQDKLTDAVDKSAGALDKGADATGKQTKGLDGLVASLISGSTSTGKFVGGLVSLAVASTGAGAPLAALGGSVATLGFKIVAVPFEVFVSGLKGITKVAKWAGQQIVAALKKAFDLVKTVAVQLVKGVGIAVAAIASLPVTLDLLFRKVMVGAGKLVGVNAAFLAIAREGAPALLEALRAGSLGMVEQTDLMEQYVSAVLLVNKAMADQLPEALGYLTKIALATGESMDYLIDSLVRGVGRLSPKILDNLKIQVSLAEATARATVMFGKQADALSVSEKQAGMMAVAMDKLRAKTSGLADATGSLVQLMAESKTLQAEGATLFASLFIPVAKSFYNVQIAIAKAFKASVSEGGKWYNTIRKVSATLSVLVDLAGEFITKMVGSGRAIDGLEGHFGLLEIRAGGAGQNVVDTLANKMFEAAWKAFEWGANIVNNLAIGMVRGITTSLMWAINAISNFLGYWLAPGSAPQIVPNLLSWGASAFTEYLRGFTMADFDILTGVQAPLEGALRNLVALGTISQEDANSMFINISEAMAQAIATGDFGAALAGLGAVGGEYGAELEELFKRQMEVARATNAVEEAERRLLAARNLEEASGKRLSRQARDYNRLLKEGASDEILRQKLAEMKATYATLEGARDAAEVAEDDKAIAEERAQEAQRLANLQNELLQQLIKMGQVWADMGDGGGITPPDPEDFLPPFEGVIDGIDAAFGDLKDRIRARFQALWDELKADWEKSGVGKLIEELKARWADSTLKEWWDEFMFDVKEDGIRTALANLWLKIAQTTQAFLDDKFIYWANIWRAFTQKGIEDGTGQIDLGAGIEAMWEEVKRFSRVMADGLAFWIGFFIGEKVSDMIWKIGDWFGHILIGSDADSKGMSLADRFITGFWTGLLAGLEDKINQWPEKIRNFFAGGVAAVIGYLMSRSPSELFRGIAHDMIDGLLLGIEDRALHLGQSLVDAVRNAFNRLGEISLWQRGHDFIENLRQGAQAKIDAIGWADMGRAIRDRLASGLSGLGDAIKGAMNGVIGVIERAIDHVVTGINRLIDLINCIPGAGWIPRLNYIDFPRLAQGGMVTATEQLAILHGPEIVLPLNSPSTQRALTEAMVGAFGARGGGEQVTIHNHFGQGSIRNKNDVLLVADAIQKSLELRGVRARIA